MAIQLYAHPFSSYCQKVLIALYENAIPFEWRLLAPENPQAMAELAARWPFRRFPLLLDGERALSESSIIIEYLQQHYPGATRLLPEDADSALEVRFMDRCFDLYVSTPMTACVFDQLRPEAQRDAWAWRRRGSCCKPPTAGSTRKWPGANGPPAPTSAWPTARLHRHCSMPTG